MKLRNLTAIVAAACLAGAGHAAEVTLTFDSPTQGIGSSIGNGLPGTTLSFDLGAVLPINALNDDNVFGASLQYTVRNRIDEPPAFNTPNNPDRVTGPTIVSRGFEQIGTYTITPYVTRAEYQRLFYAINQLTPSFSIATDGSTASTHEVGRWAEHDAYVHQRITNEINLVPEPDGQAMQPEIVEIDTYTNVYYELAGISETLNYGFEFEVPDDGILDFEMSFLNGSGDIELVSAELSLILDGRVFNNIVTSEVPIPAGAILFPGAALGLLGFSLKKRRETA